MVAVLEIDAQRRTPKFTTNGVTTREMKPNPCPNLNHRHADAPVRYCPNCGKVVNDRITIKTCREEIHRKKRMDFSRFCVDCGEQLIK